MPLITIPVKLQDEYIAIVERVNNSKTEAEHRRWEMYREGFVAAGTLCYGDTIMGNIFMKADLHYDCNRPMCAGVWLDWEATNAS